jgi:hypothetical protein
MFYYKYPNPKFVVMNSVGAVTSSDVFNLESILFLTGNIVVVAEVTKLPTSIKKLSSYKGSVRDLLVLIDNLLS